jgi:hypothetical protein
LAGMARRTMTQSRWKKTPRCVSGRLSPHVFHGNLNHDSQDQKPQHSKQQFLRPRTVTHQVTSTGTLELGYSVSSLIYMSPVSVFCLHDSSKEAMFYRNQSSSGPVNFDRVENERE